MILAGCDIGDPGGFEPPAVHVTLTSPANGDGVGCPSADPSCGVPLQTEVVVHFDRLLWPEPLAFESVRIYTGTPRNRVPVSSAAYDPLERTLTYQVSRLQPRALYRVQLPGQIPGEGPRAFDGGELEDGPAPLSFSFFTQSPGVAELPRPVPGRTPSCDEIVEVLGTHCGSDSCHGGSAPAMGLGLDTRQALSNTALRKVAHQTDSAGTPGIPQSHPPRFGVAMPIIDPGSAATSYLVYKLLIADGDFPECAGEHCARFQSPDGPERCGPVPENEQQRLRDWFVRGEPMPLHRANSTPRLDCSSFRALLRFIDSGAACD